MSQPAPAPVDPRKRFFKRLGLAGFAILLIKGLLWLALPALIAARGCS